MKKKASKRWVVLTAVTAVLLAVCIVAIPVTNAFSSVISVALNAKTQEVIPDPEATVHFTSNYDNEEDLVAFEKELCESIEAEGAALLLNNDNTLPLAEGTKFTTFSQSSYNLMYGGTGSGQVSAEDAVTLKEALEDAFGEGTVNPAQWDFYANCGYARVNADTTGGNQAQYRINEVPWSEYTQDLQDTWPEYGDVALVVLARSGGEGADLPSGLPELEPYMTDGDYLQLCQEEIDMLTNLQQLKEQGVFKKIVVLLNSSNTLQLDFLDSYGIDAALWIGDVGMTGINGVADILAGNVAGGIASDEPVVLVLFGDHKPWGGNGNSAYAGIGADFDLSTLEGFYEYYSTPYLIWANSAAKEALDRDFQGEGGDFSPCFLMNELFEQCGWTGPAFLQYAEEIRSLTPLVHSQGLYLTPDGELTDDLPQEVADRLLEYQWVEYYREHKVVPTDGT